MFREIISRDAHNIDAKIIISTSVIAVSHEPSPSSIYHTFQWKSDLRPTMPNVRIDPKNAGDDHGHMFRLPAEKEPSKRAARWVHGKGIVEGPNRYPVIVVSRPAEESHMVYTNSKTTDTPHPRLDRWFRMRLPDKNKVFKRQKPSPQYQSHVCAGTTQFKVKCRPEHMKPALYRSVSEPNFWSMRFAQKIDARRYSVPYPVVRGSYKYPGASNSPLSDSWAPGIVEYGTSSLPQQVFPDTEGKSVARNSISWHVWQPIDSALRRLAAGFEGETMTKKIVVRRPMTQFWVKAKGVMAVAIASV